MTPDVIVSWPHSCDYPLWRQFVRDNRERFAKVIVVFTTNAQGPYDYRPFVRANFPDVTFIDSPPLNGRDWRDVAVNAGLDASDAEWVWFMEQDFEITDPESFWDQVRRSHWLHVIGWRDQLPRFHPSCLFVQRSVIERTSRYFGPVPVDHFYRFSEELVAIGDMSHLFRDRFTHMQGLSQNHFLIDTGQTEGVFKLDEFHDYLRRCLEADVPLDAGWAERAQKEIGMVTA